MEDSVSRIVCRDLKLRAYTVLSKETVTAITGIHGTTPNATIALGRVINAAALLGATLKPDSDQNISLRLSGTGPVKEIIAQADARGNIRGYAGNPSVDLTDDIGTISFSKTIGAGLLSVTKDLGLKEPYKSIIPLRSGELAGDMAYYLTLSEQIPSAIILALQLDKSGGIESSGGILIQTYPDTDEKTIASVESNIGAMKTPLGVLIRGREMNDILEELFNGAGITVAGRYPLRAACRCNRDMLSAVLSALPEADLRHMMKDDGGAGITCSFCKKEYRFDADELGSMMKGTGLH